MSVSFLVTKKAGMVLSVVGTTLVSGVVLVLPLTETSPLCLDFVAFMVKRRILNSFGSNVYVVSDGRWERRGSYGNPIC